jgi:adenine-specific DNA-methyltransferase
MTKYRGFVGENHIVILEQDVDRPAVTPKQLAALLRSRPVDRYFRCISGATNVSAFELNQLVLPDPEVLKQELSKGGLVDAIVMRAFGITSS